MLQFWIRRLLAILAICFIGAQANAATSRDFLTLLVPDNANVKDWPIQVWIDTAAEEGLQIKLISDSAFLALDTAAAKKITGLILPDSAHIQASDTLVAAVKRYVADGGALMLTYDAGALTERGTYALTGRSRFSDLVGVDYVLYEKLRNEVVGFHPIVGTKGTMDALSLPPGKYVPFLDQVAAKTADSATRVTDPAERRESLACESKSGAAQSLADARLRMRNSVSADASADGGAWSEAAPNSSPNDLLVTDKTLQSISGYALGTLSYHHFVVAGAFPGTSLLCSPDGGLVAGVRPYGKGKLLFVNIPLGYYKAVRTDSVLLHGFLNLFARDQVVMPRLSVQPKGIGGLIYNWHVDDRDDLLPDFEFLMAQDFMQNQGPFSIHLTAGPDVSKVGDGLGMNLPDNAAAQFVVRQADKKHELGSHGGWNHNIYGSEANETNASVYQPWLEQNVAAIEGVIDHPLREYSAPMGNNPMWAIKWLERHGVVGMYTVGNSGTAALREWRGGQRVGSQIWAMPIAPFGKHATFEEFQRNGVSDQATAQWLLDLQNFVVNNRTNRLFYNHPPGAKAHLGVVKMFVERAAHLASLGRFSWYSMAQIADFSQRRLQTVWRSDCTADACRFVTENPSALTDMTWLLPRTRYELPKVIQGTGTVVSTDPSHWLVTATSGTRLTFTAKER